MPATPADFGFDPDDLTPLGSFYMNDLRFRVEETAGAFRVLPPGRAVWVNGVLWSVIALFFVGTYVLVDRLARPDDRPWARFAVVGIGVMTCGGGFAFGMARQKHFERRGPVIDFDKRTGRLRIAGGRTFDRADIVGLLCCEFPGSGDESGPHDELQLVAHADGRRQRFLLMTYLGGGRHGFDYIARPFAKATGLRFWRVWPSYTQGGRLLME